MSEIPDNDPAFGSDAESIVRDWCERAGIAFGGHAEIGHDAANRVVPFNFGQINHISRSSPSCAQRGIALYLLSEQQEGQMAKGTGRKAGGGLARPVTPSADLAAIVGFGPAAA